MGSDQKKLTKLLQQILVYSKFSFSHIFLLKMLNKNIQLQSKIVISPESIK